MATVAPLGADAAFDVVGSSDATNAALRFSGWWNDRDSRAAA